MSENSDMRQSFVEPLEDKMLKQPRDYDMDDSDEVERWPNLRDELTYCSGTVGEAYREADSASMYYRTEHKVLVFVAAACGMLAVLFAIVQLSSLQQPNMDWVMYAEAGAAFVAVVAVVFGTRVAFSKKWILERQKAEQCRHLKFSFLSSPALWTQREWLRDRVRELDTLNKDTLEHWAEREDDIFERAPLEVPVNISEAKLEELVDYYTKKRLRYQRRYFEGQAQHRYLWERFTSVAPVLFFFASILAALGHFVYDLIHSSHLYAEHDKISLGLILLAACLPVVGGAFRTLRIAHEFGRNALRFRATTHELGQLEAELQSKSSLLAKLEVLQKAEQVLEAERREWLRLMLDAEWYG
jgi:hypothetical protein